jgi:hypothetical protein
MIAAFVPLNLRVISMEFTVAEPMMVAPETLRIENKNIGMGNLLKKSMSYGLNTCALLQYIALHLN